MINDISENFRPKTPPPNNIINKASLVPKLPGINDGNNVITPNITPNRVKIVIKS